MTYRQLDSLVLDGHEICLRYGNRDLRIVGIHIRFPSWTLICKHMICPKTLAIFSRIIEQTREHYNATPASLPMILAIKLPGPYLI